MKQQSPGQCATLACLWEASYPKPGNVHRGADFEDVSFYDFLTSAAAIGPAMDTATTQSLGKTILAAVEATQQLVSTNTNLGMILLIAPLAAVDAASPLQDGISSVLDQLDLEDARLVYQAISIAKPGGMGTVEEMDLQAAPPDDLIKAMQASAERDLIARQYAENFAPLFNTIAPWFQAGLDQGWSLGMCLVHTQLQTMAQFPDSLIARKCGEAVALEAATRAQQVLDAGTPGSENYDLAVGDLDFWLRSDGHRRNPGTTADLLAAGLFVLLREGKINFLRTTKDTRT